LPGPYGIGDLGPSAFAWIDALVRSRQTWWQILPLGPTGFGDSPYQCACTFAGNTYLISPELLVQDGLIKASDLTGCQFPEGRVDYGPVINAKIALLTKAWNAFQAGAGAPLRSGFESFCAQQASWLDDFALFMALKNAHGGADWFRWEPELARREPWALERARNELRGAIGQYRFGQFLFFKQWKEVKRHANSRGIRLIGDVPIFVAADSSDVWGNQGLYHLDPQGKPRVVAGVPPDYFSATGQLWGNPLYDWDALKRTNYAWWVARMRATLEQVDVVRIDHFRGFESYWEIPAGLPTAVHGRWAPGPKDDLFHALRSALGGLPLIAEDLGLITPEVKALRERLRLPGMRILQFAFGDFAANPYLPHHYERETVVYTGTHDNDTTRGWFATASEKESSYLRRYLSHVSNDVAWDLMRLAWSSVADFAIAPLQDVLSLGTEARMNLPGRPAGNWGWRYTRGMLNDGVLDRLGDLTEVYGRSRR
jgi:4-alpha-glucanotransferase